MTKTLICLRTHFNHIFLFGLTLVILMITSITPPFQAPDEFKHFERAYTISKGSFFLGSNGNGFIDKNLIEFEKIYEILPLQHNNRVSMTMHNQAKTFNWSDDVSEVPLSNTAVYFPAPYIPLSIGIYLGEKLNLSIYQTYKLAKYTSIFFCLTLLLIANKIYPFTYLGYLLLAFPMTMFQIASANPDGILFSLAMILGAILLKGYQIQENFSWKLFVLGCVITFIISTMKMNVFPIILLFLPIAYIRKINYGYRFIFLTISLILLWIIFAYFSYTNSMHESQTFVQSNLGMTDKIRYYLSHPIEFTQIFINTFTINNPNLLSMYYQQFIGVLGWIDVLFSTSIYKAIFIFTIIFVLLGIDFKNLISKQAIFNFFVFISIIFLTFLLLLLNWTPLGEQYIHGVQGRYFIPLALIYSFFYIHKSKYIYSYQAAVLIMLIFSSTITLTALLERYYIS